MKRSIRQFCCCGVLTAVALCSACAPHDASPASSVSQAWEHRRDGEPTARPRSRSANARSSGAADSTAASDSPGAEPIATVNGKPVDRGEFVALLIRSRGAAILEQLVGLAAAESYAVDQGVVITDADVDFEYDLALRRLFDPLTSTTSAAFDRAGSERLLDAVLDGRMMSRPEYMLTVRRNAHLRKVVAAQLAISDDQLRSEHELAYGDRVQVRHIQLANLVDASRIKERLAAGEDFAELASRYSTNITTARHGGLLEPFSLRDEDIPQAFRQVAANLKPGDVSDLVRIGEWFHVLKMERRIPAETHEFDEVKESLRRRLLVRLTDARIRTLFEKLIREASVQIADPVLREAFQAAHPDVER
jgi:foldase protein PrsA